jgi:Tol biopolymer transport system component
VIYHADALQVGLAQVNPDGAGFAMLVDDGLATAPSISSDGRSLIYMSQTGGSWDIYRANADGSGRVRLTDNPANDGLPAWSPDGRSIAFLSDRSGAWSLWVMNANGSAQREVARLPGGPDGRVGGEPDYSTRGWTEERISWGP